MTREEQNERALLEQVLAEQISQNKELFDMNTALKQENDMLKLRIAALNRD